MYLCKVKSKLNIKTVTSMRKIFTSVLVLFPLLAWGQNWNETTKTLQLVNVTRSESITLPDGATIVLSGENKINYPLTEGAAITAEGSLRIQGEGSLDIQSGYEAIHAAGDITIEGSTLTIRTEGEGDGAIATDASISMDGCDISITTATDDGIMADGSLSITNSNLNIQAEAEEGIVCYGVVNITGNSAVDIYSGAKEAMEAHEGLVVSGSEVTLVAADYEPLYGDGVQIDNSTFKALRGNAASALSLREGEISYTIRNSWVESSDPIALMEEPVNSFVRILGATNTVYGNYTLVGDVTLPEGEALMLTEGSTLTIPEGITLTNSGTLANAGTIVIQQGGVMEGEENGEIIRDSATGIEDIEGAKVYAQEGTVYVQTPSRMKVAIVSISGATVARAEQEGLQSYSLPKGIYIICIGEQTFKVRN